MPRARRPSNTGAIPGKPAKLASRARVHPMVQEAARVLREVPGRLRGREANVEKIIALLDALAHELTKRHLIFSVSYLEFTIQQGSQSVGLRVIEQSKRSHRKSVVGIESLQAKFSGWVRKSDGRYYHGEGEKAGQPVYTFDFTGRLAIATTTWVPWGRRLNRQIVRWEEQSTETIGQVAVRVADDVPRIFECMAREFDISSEQEQRKSDEAASRQAVIEARRAADQRARAREEGQDSLIAKLVTQAVQARELRRFLAEAQRPGEGHAGYARMLTVVATRLAALERDIHPDTIEATITANDLFPLDDEG